MSYPSAFQVQRLPDFSTEQEVSLTAREAIGVIVSMYVFAAGLMLLSHSFPIPAVFTAPPIVLTLSFVPGALLLLTLGYEKVTPDTEFVLYAFGVSLMTLMAVGAAINILLPPLGVTNPLTAKPLGAGVTMTVTLLAVGAFWRNPTGEVQLLIPPLWDPTPLALVLLVLLSILGVTLLNAFGFNLLILLILVVIAITPFITTGRISNRWHPFAIWTLALAILYHKSLWQYANFGGRPHGIQAWREGRWSPGVVGIEEYTSELLQNGVLFPLYSLLTDIHILTQYEVVNPFFVSFIPLAMFVTFRQYVGSNRAFVGASMFMFAHPFYYQYPTAGRAATPVIFLTLFGVSLAGVKFSARTRTGLGLLFLCGVVVTHYGTSYYVATGFALALILIYGLRVSDKFVQPRLQAISYLPDGGAVRSQDRLVRRKMFSWSLYAFFVSAALGWYMFMRGGIKFALLPKHIEKNLRELTRAPQRINGRTAARVQESYASMSIEIAKYIYILLAVLILLGITVTLYRRIVFRESRFDDHYLTIGTAMFGIFGMTILFRNWGGGRPMMIAFSFATIFAVLATEWIFSYASKTAARTRRQTRLDYQKYVQTLRRRVSDELPFDGQNDLSTVSPGIRAFAAVILVLFLLNTGTVAVFTGEFAPSNVPNQNVLLTDDNPNSQVIVHQKTDISTHIWVVRFHGGEKPIYADTFGARQYDWYRPYVVGLTPSAEQNYNNELKPEVMNVTAQRNGTQPGYLLILGHNLELSNVWPSKFTEPVPLEQFNLSERHRVYDSGESHVYLPATEPRAESSNTTA